MKNGFKIRHIYKKIKFVVDFLSHENDGFCFFSVIERFFVVVCFVVAPPMEVVLFFCF